MTRRVGSTPALRFGPIPGRDLRTRRTAMSGVTEVKSTSPVSADEAKEIGIEAFVWLYPLLTMEITRRQMTNLPAGQKPGLAPWASSPTFASSRGLSRAQPAQGQRALQSRRCRRARHRHHRAPTNGKRCLAAAQQRSCCRFDGEQTRAPRRLAEASRIVFRATSLVEPRSCFSRKCRAD
jgi:hypothetical protein